MLRPIRALDPSSPGPDPGRLDGPRGPVSSGRRATVCQLLHGLRVGGAEVLAARMARRLRDDYRFTFICLDELGGLGERLRDEGFPVHVLDRRPGLDWRCARRLAGLLRRERVDLLHAHQYTPFFYGMMARCLARRPPLLFTEHGRWFPDHPRRRRIIANRLLLRRRDRVVGVGEAVRRALIDNEGIPDGRVGLIYNGIELDAFAGGVGDRRASRRELGVPEEALVLLQVARLDPLKDHATAIRMMERLVRRRPDARLVLVGEGPELRMIREEIDRRGLGPHVHLAGLRHDVGRLLPAADLLLLTSLTEGIPLTVIEAMAASLPVVATDVGGLKEVVDDGRTGLLAPARDDEALAEASLRLAERPGLRRRMGELGRARALAMFSEERMLDGYRRLYEEMLDG